MGSLDSWLSCVNNTLYSQNYCTSSINKISWFTNISLILSSTFCLVGRIWPVLKLGLFIGPAALLDLSSTYLLVFSDCSFPALSDPSPAHHPSLPLFHIFSPLLSPPPWWSAPLRFPVYLSFPLCLCYDHPDFSLPPPATHHHLLSDNGPRRRDGFLDGRELFAPGAAAAPDNAG